MGACKTGWLMALVAAGSLASAQAQDFQQVAPKPVPPAGGPPPEAPAPPPQTPVGGSDGTLVLINLKGLVLVDSPGKIKKEGVSITGLQIQNLPLLDDPGLRSQLTAFLGQPVTFGDLKKISQLISAFYIAHNRPFMDVTFPAQDVNSGAIQAVVTEFHLGQVKVEGNDWFSSDLLRGYVHETPGQPIDLQSLNNDIAALNQNPFRRVSVVAQKSDTPGDTDLDLKTEDRFPLRAYVSYDDYGTPVLGFDRWSAGLTWGNLLGLDQQISYQITVSDDFFHHRASPTGDPALQAHSLSWLAPLPWGDKLTIFGSYSQAVPQLGPDLNLTGVTGQASLRYVMGLPHVKPGLFGVASDLVQDLQLGYDFKTSNNDLSFGGFEVSNVTTEVDQFLAIYDATLTNSIGETDFSNTFSLSPGNLTSQNRTALFQAQGNTPFAAADYIYDNFTLTQTTRLPYDLAWVLRLNAQMADHNLLPSEELGAGGHDTVRGYDERSANGSEGILLSQELRSPSFHLIAPNVMALPDGVTDQAQLLAFWDYASVREHQVTPGSPSSFELSSMGAGIRYSLSRYVDLRADYGDQLLRLPGAKKLGQVLHVSLTAGF